ncbi:MAG: universal stress protein [Thermoleophilia bacterium]
MSEHPVIACYRGLDSADGVGLAALLAQTLDQPLVLASAYHYEAIGLGPSALPAADNDRRADAAMARLQRARRFVPPGIDVREEVVPATGVPEALTALARDIDACVLTVGRDTSGRVTRSLLSRAPCPIAVAPLSVPLPRSGPLRRIGVAYDGSTTAQSALVAAMQLARATDAQLVLLGAGTTAERAAVWLHVARLAIDDDIDRTARELVGDPASVLAEASADVDLLVCGTRGRGRALGKLLGSVSAHLLTHAECPLIVVPPVVWRSDRGPLGLTSAASNA